MQHIGAARWGRERNIRKREWINGLLAKGEKPILVILEKCCAVNVNERERWWIDRYGGEKLTNRIGHVGQKQEADDK